MKYISRIDKPQYLHVTAYYFQEAEDSLERLLDDAARAHGTVNGWRSCAWYSFLLPKKYHIGQCTRCRARRLLKELKAIPDGVSE